MYDHAKDRTQLLAETIPQDYNEIIKAAQTKGFDNVKILVIGSPGTGKTMSLKTLQTQQTTEGDSTNG
jgi:Cdc6-like AAA superfamily ATPase